METTNYVSMATTVIPHPMEASRVSGFYKSRNLCLMTLHLNSWVNLDFQCTLQTFITSESLTFRPLKFLWKLEWKAQSENNNYPFCEYTIFSFLDLPKLTYEKIMSLHTANLYHFRKSLWTLWLQHFFETWIWKKKKWKQLSS